MNKKILIVEDEKSLLEAISTKLIKNEFIVVKARTYEEAILALKNNNDIGVIWLDHYLMGKKDGLDIITECKKENSRFNNIPIFVVSNTASSDKIEKYLGLGAVKYYVKAEKKLEDIIKDINKYFDNSI